MAEARQFGDALLTVAAHRVYGEIDALQDLVEGEGLDRDEARAAAWVLIQRVRGLRADLARVEKARASFAAAAEAAYDEGREGVLGEFVCSVCGENHDRDESSACDGCEAIRFDEWVARVRAGLWRA